ncbi:hypothetical protein DsansV1_C07g0071661 [Dioscorea sansibarensis]
MTPKLIPIKKHSEQKFPCCIILSCESDSQSLYNWSSKKKFSVKLDLKK